MSYKKGDKIISLLDEEVFIVKYILGNSVVVQSKMGYNYPIRFERVVPYSPLMEELLWVI